MDVYGVMIKGLSGMNRGGRGFDSSRLSLRAGFMGAETRVESTRPLRGKDWSGS
jgi:hypothetical protein